MNNADIRFKAQSAGVKLWQIGERLNLNDGNFSRKLRKELSGEEKAQIMHIIDEISRNN